MMLHDEGIVRLKSSTSSSSFTRSPYDTWRSTLTPAHERPGVGAAAGTIAVSRSHPPRTSHPGPFDAPPFAEETAAVVPPTFPAVHRIDRSSGVP